MKSVKTFATLLAAVMLLVTVGCAATRTPEGTGQYSDDSAITAKVKAAILGDASLIAAEINVETFMGVVRLSGFVSSQDDINRAVRLARSVSGVKSVTNRMQLM